MKHGSALLFRHSFGTLIQDNTDTFVDEGGFECSHTLVGSALTGRRSAKADVQERSINEEVLEWRINFLHGIKGEPCPCRKVIVRPPTDEEIAHREATNRAFWQAERRPYEPMELQRVDQRDLELMTRFGLESSTIPVIYRRRATVSPEIAFAMLGGYRPDRHGPYVNLDWVCPN